MEYTTNYHLPQWVETDHIMMGDFNEAMANIEEGLNRNAEAAETLPYQYGKITIPLSTPPSTTLLNFDFSPQCVVIGAGSTAILYQGGAVTVYTSVPYSSNNASVLALYLKGNVLTLGYISSTVTSDVVISYIALS